MATRTGGGVVHIVDGVTSVDCHNRVRSWSLLRSVMWFIIPSCTRNNSDDQQLQRQRGADYYYNNRYLHYLQPRRSRSVSPPICTNTTISTSRINNISTGTIFGYRHGKVNLCFQSNPNSNIPTLLLELAIPTAVLAKEMRGGLLRIALECNTESRHSSSPHLLSAPVWTMYCNGRRVGSATKRVPSLADKKVLCLMRNVDEGVGIINGKTLRNSIDDNKEVNQHNQDDLMYLRANFERIYGSPKSESFHLINKDGSNSQQLSIFFIRTG
ncbi:protein MIZU-KUSSEI 1-like [Papaver somniferum]|uniref:protein MIZU-KUSSEI 1-like n=1 Tax=Papaver somniferum TaxID=3469 RepID=UPI000E6F8B65|nr:protein MIZU-KUSSEI 1-like [Papaver somniferum]